MEDGFGCYAILDKVVRSQVEAAKECAAMEAQLVSLETLDELHMIQRLFSEACKTITIFPLSIARNELTIINIILIIMI